MASPLYLAGAHGGVHLRSVASKSDLLRFRAVTVVDRGENGQVDDFRWLLSEVAKARPYHPGLIAVLPFSRNVIHKNLLRPFSHHEYWKGKFAVPEKFPAEIKSNCDARSML